MMGKAGPLFADCRRRKRRRFTKDDDAYDLGADKRKIATSSPKAQIWFEGAAASVPEERHSHVVTCQAIHASCFCSTQKAA